MRAKNGEGIGTYVGGCENILDRWRLSNESKHPFRQQGDHTTSEACVYCPLTGPAFGPFVLGCPSLNPLRVKAI